MYRLASIILLLFYLVTPIEAAHVRIAWDNPTTNTDGSSLTNMAGNIVYFGPKENKYANTNDVGMTNQVVLHHLKVNTFYYITVRSYNTYNALSIPSKKLKVLTQKVN